mmetsp:Transcript_37698/g.104985  ORF Transcript_37698/g.104985 Transcript_37698/m.104985 type:complete len:239 (+) Transcript_37698:273-989(+)
MGGCGRGGRLRGALGARARPGCRAGPGRAGGRCAGRRPYAVRGRRRCLQRHRLSHQRGTCVRRRTCRRCALLRGRCALCPTRSIGRACHWMRPHGGITLQVLRAACGAAVWAGSHHAGRAATIQDPHVRQQVAIGGQLQHVAVGGGHTELRGHRGRGGVHQLHRRPRPALWRCGAVEVGAAVAAAHDGSTAAAGHPARGVRPSGGGRAARVPPGGLGRCRGTRGQDQGTVPGGGCRCA